MQQTILLFEAFVVVRHFSAFKGVALGGMLASWAYLLGKDEMGMKDVMRVVTAACMLVFAGCKVGTIDENNSYQPERLPGDFYNSQITRNYYPDAEWATGRAGRDCASETTYFETRNGRVRVYGSTAYSETTFRVAATEIDNRINNVLASYGWRWLDFVYDRPTNTPYPRHILVCLNNVLSYSQFTESSLSGISVAPYHRQWPEDAGRQLDRALHEFVQNNLAGFEGYSSAPEWFMKGHAASVSGWDSVESYRHYEQNPVVEDNPELAHSILAYEYLASENGADSASLLWMGLREIDGDSGFGEVFDALAMQDHHGQPLTYQRFSRDYHVLVARSR